MTPSFVVLPVRDGPIPRRLASVANELEFEDTFEGDVLDLNCWLPYYLPHWSSRERSAARYEIGDGLLRLLIEEDQQPWCPELDGDIPVSSLQTGEFAVRSAARSDSTDSIQQRSYAKSRKTYGCTRRNTAGSRCGARPPTTHGRWSRCG
jgi:hypothetical protein